jgi:ribosomal-protein-alanine N-acetyltransferase
VVEYSFSKLLPDKANEIIQWRYLPPYDLYNLSEEALAGLLNPTYRYHQVEDQEGYLVGFCCFGEDAQVPGGDYWVGEPTILDIGVGLNSELVGKGMGKDFVRAILDFAIIHYQPVKLRATIAQFNQRSIRTFQNLGFEISKIFVRDLVVLKFCQLEIPVNEVKK